MDFELLERRVVDNLIQLGREFLVDLGDPALDVGFDVLGNDLARLDDVREELSKVIFGLGLLVGALRPSRREHLIEQAGRFHGLIGRR